MDYSKKQKELDVIKWLDSETKNYDTCGEYSYCKNCNKSKEFPCAYAYEYYKDFTTSTKKSSTGTKKSTSTKKYASKTSKSTTGSYKTSSPKKTLKTSTSSKSTSKKTTSKVAA